MSPYEAAQRYIKELEASIAAKRDNIVSGNFARFEDYKFECGVLRGMCIALDEFKQHAAHME